MNCFHRFSLDSFLRHQPVCHRQSSNTGASRYTLISVRAHQIPVRCHGITFATMSIANDFLLRFA